jgi:hypothetical protein
VHPVKEGVEVVPDQIFEQNEAPLTLGRTLDRNEARQRRRNFDAGEMELDAFARRLFEFDRERQREVRDVRKGMSAIDR